MSDPLSPSLPLSLSPSLPLTLALPKGRVFAHALALFQQAGLPLTLPEQSRQLRHHFPGVTVLELRNADVPVYVDLGVADLGVVGKDVLLEAGRSVYEPLDLDFGHCRLSLIREVGASGPVRRVASKYPRFTQHWLSERGSSAEVIELGGNIELACLTGLADAVVDIVETGGTLRANALTEVEVLARSSARLIVNRASLKLKAGVLRPLIGALEVLVKGT